MENLAEQEREVQALSAEINDLRKRIEAETVPPSARLAQLRSQNQKLKYQKMHLERYVDGRESNQRALAIAVCDCSGWYCLFCAGSDWAVGVTSRE